MGTHNTLMPLWHVMRGGLTWLLYDSYGTPDSAPIADPLTPDPGPGLSTVVDTENKFSISNGDLVCAGGKAAPGWGDPGIWLGRDNAGSPATQAAGYGKGIFHSVTPGNVTSLAAFGLDSNAATFLTSPAFTLSSSEVKVSSATSKIGVYTATLTKLLQVQRSSTHGYYFIRDGKLLWADETAVTDPLFVGISNNSMPFSLHERGLIDLPANGFPLFTNDWLGGGGLGIATYHNATPSANDTDDSLADAVHQFKWTVTAAETLELFIRRIDDTHTWIVRADEATNLIKLIEVDGGETEQSSTAQTWTPTTEYDIRIHADGVDIEVFVDGISKNTYGTATYNQTSTGTKAAGFASGSAWNAWPRYPALPGHLK